MSAFLYSMPQAVYTYGQHLHDLASEILCPHPLLVPSWFRPWCSRWWPHPFTFKDTANCLFLLIKKAVLGTPSWVLEGGRDSLSLEAEPLCVLLGPSVCWIPGSSWYWRPNKTHIILYLFCPYLIGNLRTWMSSFLLTLLDHFNQLPKWILKISGTQIHFLNPKMFLL